MTSRVRPELMELVDSLWDVEFDAAGIRHVADDYIRRRPEYRAWAERVRDMWLKDLDPTEETA
jgi:hypothetical protein